MKRLLPCLLFLFAHATLPAQENLAERMETAIAQLRAAGQDDPRTIALMLNSCAEGYIREGDLETAFARIRESLILCREHDVDPTASFFTASKILSQSDDEAATGFLIAELNAPGASVLYRKGVLKALQTHLAIHGDQKLQIQVSYELLQLTSEENPGTEEEFWALFTFGNHCLSGKLYDQAAPALKRAQELSAELGKPELAAHCVRAIGFTLMAQGQLEEALPYFEKEVELNRADPQKLFTGFALRNLANTQIQLGKLDEAEVSLEEASGLARDAMDKAFILSMESAIAFRRAFAADGAQDFEEARAKQQETVEAKLSYAPAGEEMARLATIPDFITLACLHLLDDNLDAAEEALTEATLGADAWEANSRTAQESGVFSADQINLSMADIRSGIFDFQQQVAVRRGDLEGALVVAENGRGTAQAELLRERLGLPTSDRVVKELTLDEIREVAREHDLTLVVYATAQTLSPDLKRYFPFTDRVQHPRALYAWVVETDGAIHFEEIELDAPLAELVEAAREEITVPPPEGEDPGTEALRALSARLIDPIREHLPEEPDTPVAFIPQGELFLVPFAALPDENGRFLVEDHVITLSPSIELLRLARERRKAVDAAGLTEILLVGNPTMPGYQPRPDRDAVALSPLPGAEAEAKHLGSVLEAEPLIGDDATETAVASRMEQARFLHFATHGLLEAENAYNQSLLSSLAFASCDKEDGFLTVKETARMNLRAELAVLSACDTGRGRISGDGVIGLSRGYITAGVPTVVVSLWPVSDQATAVLMEHYYGALLEKTPKAAALREAILKTKEQFPSPRLWAPFVSYGHAL